MKENVYNRIQIPEAYEVVSSESLPDIHADGLLLRHKKSGARLALIPCEDENKVFSIAFRTPPTDSTGVAHIIEHTVLCGSEEFPLKDPFVELVKGSLNTFLNAMTYPDKTVYSIASTNDADFRNLMHIYLDAVFRPNIYHEQNIFRQEGWHYELHSAEEPLTVNGVVYNEMKGAFSSADSLLERETMNALFPDTAYGVESGGDPAVIPELTYEQYLNFHRRYYHPSNSYIYLYGDVDMADTLAFIDEHYLSGYDLQPIDSTLKMQEPFEETAVVRKSYPVTEEEDTEGRAYFSYNSVTGEAMDLRELLAFEVIDYALFSAPGAPVRQALLDAGIGSDVYGEFNDGILQPYFSVVAKDAPEDEAEHFCEIIRSSLTEQINKGIDRESLRAGINHLEFQFREADFGQFPKGLMYGLDLLDTWLYDETKPFTGLRQLEAFAFLKNAVETGYFEELIRSKLIDNPHSALVVLTPEKGLLEKTEQELTEKLAAYRESLSEEEIAEIIEKTEALTVWQETPETQEDIEKIPLLSRSDLRREIRHYSNIEEKIETGEGGSRQSFVTVFHEADTNGIIYPELLFDVHDIPEEEIPYLGLLRSVLFNMDTENYSYLDLTNRIHLETGGIGGGVSVMADAHDPDDYQAYFSIRGKSLYEKAGEMFGLMDEVMSRTKFGDLKRLHEILAQTRSQLQMMLQQAGHSAAGIRAMAYTSPAAAMQDRLSGIEYYRFLKQLEENFEERGAETAEKLEGLAKRIFRGDALTASCTAEQAGFDVFRREVGACVPAAGTTERVFCSVKPYGRRNEAFRTAGQVQFVAMTGNFRRHGLPYRGGMQILRQLLSYEYLWQAVRVKGGAYGCSGSFRQNGGVLLSSYRDPHLKQTLDTYREIPAYLRGFEADERTMTKFVIGTMSTVDMPQTPSQSGDAAMAVWLMGVTEEERQANRNQILDATDETIRELADAAEAAIGENSLCVIGGAPAIDRHADLFDHVENLI